VQSVRKHAVFLREVSERPQKSSLRVETAHSLNADLRLVSERSGYMRTER
jgi:hypothetical protein